MSPETDLNQLAADLAAATARLNEHIEWRARQIAEPEIERVRLAAVAAITEAQDAQALEENRHDDLERELRRQMRARQQIEVRYGNALSNLAAALRGQLDDLPEPVRAAYFQASGYVPHRHLQVDISTETSRDRRRREQGEPTP